MKKKLIARILLTLIFALGFITFACDAQSEECLSYEPSKVRLTGTIIEKTFPGPPEWTSIEKGDRPETRWILKLSKPICVNGDPNDEINVETEKNVRNMHLVFGHENYARYKHLLNRKVIAEGTLYHAHTAHHRTRVLLTVISIKPAKDENKK